MEELPDLVVLARCVEVLGCPGVVMIGSSCIVECVSLQIDALLDALLTPLALQNAVYSGLFSDRTWSSIDEGRCNSLRGAAIPNVACRRPPVLDSFPAVQKWSRS